MNQREINASLVRLTVFKTCIYNYISIPLFHLKNVNCIALSLHAEKSSIYKTELINLLRKSILKKKKKKSNNSKCNNYKINKKIIHTKYSQLLVR